MKNIFAKAVVDETFDTEHSIYDLSEYLGAVSLFDTPDFNFNGDNVNVTEGDNSVTYYYADPQMVISPQKDITMPECEVKFLLNNDTLNKIKRASSALGHDEISITPAGGSIEIAVLDTKNKTGNAFSITVEGDYPEGATFKYVMSVNNLKLIGSDYEVSISTKLISNLKSTSSDLEYFIALEKTSTYGE